jgi:glutathionylspermidine synthase
MKRLKLTPRHDWIEKVESLGFTFHSLDNLYWDESTAYEFPMKDILKIEEATNKLHSMCLEAVQYIIDNNLFGRFDIDEKTAQMIVASWDEDHPSIYGRFDLGYNTNAPDGQQIKLLEYNADTPTSLLEAGVVQWRWLQDFNPEYDQFNSIHEKLIDYWKYLIPYLKEGSFVHFACLSDTIEDLTTTEYMRDTAIQAGLNTSLLYMEQIGYDYVGNKFYDMDENEIKNIFKLYPWEWMIKEEFSKGLFNNSNAPYFIEPAWKMLLSHKMILVVLWEMYPGNNLLLPSYENPLLFTEGYKDYVAKPVLGREGNNITIYKNLNSFEKTSGDYGDNKIIYQQFYQPANFEGNHPILGSWVVGGEAAGIGIRETDSLVTGNTSRFIPHYIKG